MNNFGKGLGNVNFGDKYEFKPGDGPGPGVYSPVDS